MAEIYLTTYPFIVGILLIVFNGKLVQFQKKLQIERNRTINESLVKTQLYIAAGLFILLGLFNLGWRTDFFG